MALSISNGSCSILTFKSLDEARANGGTLEGSQLRMVDGKERWFRTADDAKAFDQMFEKAGKKLMNLDIHGVPDVKAWSGHCSFEGTKPAQQPAKSSWFGQNKNEKAQLDQIDK
jgi:hypothetical protein